MRDPLDVSRRRSLTTRASARLLVLALLILIAWLGLRFWQFTLTPAPKPPEEKKPDEKKPDEKPAEKSSDDNNNNDN